MQFRAKINSFLAFVLVNLSVRNVQQFASLLMEIWKNPSQVSESIFKFHVSCAMVCQRKSTKIHETTFKRQIIHCANLDFNEKSHWATHEWSKLPNYTISALFLHGQLEWPGSLNTQWIQSLYKVAISKPYYIYRWKFRYDDLLIWPYCRGIRLVNVFA